MDITFIDIPKNRKVTYTNITQIKISEPFGVSVNGYDDFAEECYTIWMSFRDFTYFTVLKGE